MIVNKEYIFRKIEEIRKEFQQDNRSEKGFLSLRNLKSKIPRILKEPLLRVYHSLKNPSNKEGNIFVSEGMKIWPTDFLLYLMKNDIKFDTSIYSKEDQREIINFLDNTLKLSVKSFFNIEEGIKDYSKWDKEYSNYWKKLSKTSKKISYEGKEYYYPRDKIQTSLFYHKNGIEALPKKSLDTLKGKYFIDCGACCGDSSIVLSQLKPSKILAFEPDKNNYAILKEVVSKNRLPVEIIKEGVGEKENIVRFTNGLEGMSFVNSSGNDYVKITKIDNLPQEKVGLIKMDIEGGELEAVKGAEKTIRKNKPVLLICVYHTGKDFFEIPNLIKKFVPEYKLRFLNICKTDLICERILLAYF